MPAHDSFPVKEVGEVPTQYGYATARAEALVSSKLIPESMSLATANALTNALTFLMESGGYTLGEAMMLCSVTCDVRTAQLVDKPMVGMEITVDLSVFKGEKYAALKAAATM